jgi:outer membrane protein assembly factor BamD (BamD/ComL family)
MKKVFSVLMIALCLAAFGCTDKAEELYEPAKLEELQNNPDHARKLYREIVAGYPQSEYADKARDRLSAIKAD